MAKYNVWVGGENSWNRSYLGEVGFRALSPEQVARWIPEDVDDLDMEVLSERMHRDWGTEADGEDDFPTRDQIEDGGLGYGAYTDQTFGVAKVLENGEEEIIWSGGYGDLVYGEDYDDEEPENCPSYDVDCSDPSMSYDEATGEFTPVVGVAYHHVFKGGWGSEVVLPDDAEFDLRKLRFNVVEVEGICEIVTGFNYDGEDYFDDNGSDGKSCEWFLSVNGDYLSL